jgi:hypothetical protein
VCACVCVLCVWLHACVQHFTSQRGLGGLGGFDVASGGVEVKIEQHKFEPPATVKIEPSSPTSSKNGHGSGGVKVKMRVYVCVL